MKLFTLLLGALALVAGFTGGLRAYSASAHAGHPVPTAHVSVHHYPPAQIVRPGPVVRWAPCVKPAVRVGRACVTRVTRTVTLRAPATAPAAATPAVASPAPSAGPTPRHPSAGPHATPAHPAGGEHDDGGGGDD